MTHEIGHKNYRKLLYFYENQIQVHFKDVDEIWFNGLILDLNEEKLTMVISERVRGELPILLEFIKPNSISKFKVRE